MNFSMSLFVFVVLNVSPNSEPRFGEHTFADNDRTVLDLATRRRPATFTSLK